MRIPLAVVLCAALGCARAESPPPAPPPEPEGVRAFLDGYFGSWSRGDMEAYRAHFLERARIAFLGSDGLAWVMRLEPFVASQRRAFEGPGPKPKERYLSFEADADERAASVTVQWELTNTRGVSTGVDRFLLVRDFNGDWRIASLLFYER